MECTSVVGIKEGNVSNGYYHFVMEMHEINKEIKWQYENGNDAAFTSFWQYYK